MESALKSRRFTLYEVASVAFINSLIVRSEWHVEISDDLQVVTVNGDPSDEVQWNELLRTLVWTNSSAEDYNIMAGAV